MARSAVCLVLLLSLACYGSAQETPLEETRSESATYWVTFPSRMRRGLPVSVSVQLLATGATSTVHVTLCNSTDGRVFSSVEPQVVTGGDTPYVINLMIPRDLPIPDDNDYYFYWRYSRQFEIRVVATGDVTFNQSGGMTLEDKSFSIFVQTDKAMYKPGETVFMRILAMNPDLTVLNEPVDVLVKDPLRNVMRQWKGVLGVNSGVVELSMPTSDRLVLGEWMIEAKVLGVKQTKTFSFAEYVLPKFEAKVDLPALVLTTDSVRGTASAKYTFGKPLIGARVVVTAKIGWFIRSEMTHPNITISGTLDSQGEFPFTFDNTDLLELLNQTVSSWYRGETLSLQYNALQVIVNVTDPATGRHMKAEAEARFQQFQAKVEFLPVSGTYFKPGLLYTTYLQVTRYDGTIFENPESITVYFEITFWRPNNTATTTASPPTTTITQSRENQTNANETLDEGLAYQSFWRPIYWNPQYSEQHEETRTLTANGLVSLDVTVPEDAKSVNIKATVMNATTYRSVWRSNSPSGNFLQLLLTSRNPEVGKVVEFTARTTEPVKLITYQVYAKGTLVFESNVVSPVEAGSRTLSISFTPTAMMAPSCRVLAFYIRDDGEVVPDSLSISVNGTSDNPVDVKFTVETAKPGDRVNLVVSAKPNTTVFLLSVDKSVQLLKSGNDITQEMITEELVSYDYGSGFYGTWRYMSMCGWSYPLGGSDATQVFMGANVIMLTDGSVYTTAESMRPHYLYSAVDFRASGGREVVQMASADSAVGRIRKYFPETWLWDVVIIGPTGNYVKPEVAPDTITTWLTTAIAVHPHYGLSVTPAPAKITTFQPLFVSLDMPYSAIRGEDICLKAFAFNYYDTPLWMTLKMGRTDGIRAISLRRINQTPRRVVELRKSMKISHSLGRVDPGRLRETDFCFTPIKLGSLPIRVNLTTTAVPGDGVEQMLLVKPEGTPKSETTSVILDVRPNVRLSHTVNITFPSDVVQGSQHISVAIAGDLLGSVMENMDDLLRMPYGCGEQNMIFFAPNVFIIQYMKRTNTYTPEVAAKAQSYMLKGYQKEITYQHKDGSYSAFGESYGKSGSMWLTAFVTKCFAQSSNLGPDIIVIDQKIVTRSITWMTSIQNDNGSFPEPGVVFSKSLQGGSGTGVALTAYVMISLLETLHSTMGLGELEEQVRSATTQAQEYLEDQLIQLNDPYELAIVTYALHLANSPQKDTALHLLEQQALTEALVTHWERRRPGAQPTYYPWQYDADAALSVEMTSYALLTYLLRNDISKSLPIVRWLTSQRGPYGGFRSTQDTVIALQALSDMSTVLYSPTFAPITVTVSWSSGRRRQRTEVTIDETTRILLQQVEIPITGNYIPPSVNIQARSSGNFSGIAVAAVNLNYNVGSRIDSSIFSLTYQVETIDEKSFVLTVEFSRIDGQAGGMTVVEVGVPTGYSVDKESPQYSVIGSQMEEEGDHKVSYYYEELTKDVVRLILPMIETNGITVKVKAVPVMVYSYYSPEEQKTVYYERSETQTASICDRIEDYPNCSFLRSSPGK